mgnify:CR=1 FL=1
MMFRWLSALVGRAPGPAATAPAGRFVEARDDDAGWRPVSKSKRDLSPVTQRRMQDLAHHAWEQHRVANRLIELPIAFLLGDGVTVTAEDEDAKTWLEAWWNDPINRFDLTLEKRVRELALFGEQVIVVFVGPDGRVRHGAVDPCQIDDVIVDPDNAALPIGVRIRDDEGTTRTYRVILDGEDGELLMPAAITARETFKAGECHFWRVNELLTGRRGRSDLLSAIDIADAYTQLIFGEVERAAALRMAIWDVELTGATPEMVAQRAAEIAPPTPMSVRVHNEAEKWNSVSAKLEAGDASETLRTIRNEVLGGATIPEHWYGGGGDVNRATAAEMDEPTYKVFRRRQLLWKSILEAEAKHVIRARWKAAGRAGVPDDKCRPIVTFPSMQSVDVARYAQALGQVVAATASAVDRELITAETAVTIIAGIADKLGAEIDPDEELTQAVAAAAAKRAGSVFTPPPDPAEDPDPADPGATGGQE